MISVRGNLNKLISAGSRFQSAVQTLPDVVVTAKRIYDKPGKFSTENLAYPLNVEGDPQQGHYITFYARVTDPAKLKAFKQAKANIERIEKNLSGAGGVPGRTGSLSNLSTQQVEGYKRDKALVGGNTGGGVKSNSIQLKRGTTVRTKTAISLYMPPSVQVSYESKYGDQDISLLAEAGYDAIKAFMGGTQSKGAADTVMAALDKTGQAVKQMALSALETAAPGGKALFAIEKGKVITPKMELMFEGIGRRSFSFAFVFIPKSEQEAQVVKNIVYKFKHHMAADYVEGSSNREMSFPDMFDIEYMHIGKQNPNLNKISTCALTKMDVEYGGDRYVAYEGGVPQTTKISLTFNEFEIITKKHIEAGY